MDYLRGSASETLQTLVTAQTLDVTGRITAQWDPRLQGTATANLRSVYSLSGVPLRTESVDGGLRREIFSVAGQSMHSWDGRDGEQQTDYDALLRPILIRERIQGQPWTAVGRLHYGDRSAASALHNQCGRLVRHYDTAGVIVVDEYAMTGAPLQQGQRFLSTMDWPDWPEDLAERDRLLETTRYVTHWRYDAMDETVSQTDAKGHTRHTTFDVAGQLKAVHLQWVSSSSAQVIVDQLQYSATGNIQTHTTGNGVMSSYIYDPANGRLEELKAVKGSDLHQHFSYRYDPVGNVTAITDHTHVTRYHANQRIEGVRTFTYDSLYRLISATGLEAAGAGTQPGLPGLIPPADLSLRTPYTQQYEYDRGGNLKKLIHLSAVPGQAHTLRLTLDPTSNRCVHWRKGEAAPGDDLGFDAGGNQLTLPSSGQTLAWNARNQLQSVTQISRQKADDDAEYYTYDAQGSRARKQQRSQAAATTHVRDVRYLPGLEIRTLDDAEELHVCTLPGMGFNARGLHWEQGRPPEIEQDQVRYSLEDHLGSLMKELDQDARLISHEGYYPFGGTAWWAANSQVQASYKTIRYSGKERDASGLYYYDFRYYAPWMMRWINPDPAGPRDGLNLYAMVGNNPIKLKDKLGLNGDDFIHDFSKRTETMLRGKDFKLPAKVTQHEKFFNENPDARFTKGASKTLSAHAGFRYLDPASSERHQAYNFANTNQPKNKKDYGDEVLEPTRDRRSNPHLDFGLISIRDSNIYLAKLADAYMSKEYKIPIKKLNTETGQYEDIGAANIALGDATKQRVKAHLERTGGLVLQEAGLPGLHAEVKAFNYAAALVGENIIEDRISNLTILTQRLHIPEGELKQQGMTPYTAIAFKGCHNCTNILQGIDIPTGITEDLPIEVFNEIVKPYR
ncbi:hypothetical protein BK653_18725 [Pseudomonas brassicacearum]|nr:hypothetical protein BK653_18725 [Pseudomonas brassicacearum]